MKLIRLGVQITPVTDGQEPTDRKSLHDDGLDLHGSARQGARSSSGAVRRLVLGGMRFVGASRRAQPVSANPSWRRRPSGSSRRENSFAQLIDALAPRANAAVNTSVDA